MKQTKPYIVIIVSRSINPEFKIIYFFLVTLKKIKNFHQFSSLKLIQRCLFLHINKFKCICWPRYNYHIFLAITDTKPLNCGLEIFDAIPYRKFSYRSIGTAGIPIADNKSLFLSFMDP